MGAADIISILIIATIFFFLLFKGAKAKYSQKKYRDEEPYRYVDIKYSNGFVVLQNDEVEKWNKLSSQAKLLLYKAQQQLLKNGSLKIIDFKGNRRLITKEEYKKLKDKNLV